jgi:hypothetical protein
MAQRIFNKRNHENHNHEKESNHTTTMKTSLSHNDLRNEYLLSLIEFKRDHNERNRESLNRAGVELLRRGQTYLSTMAGTIAITATH